MRLNVRCCTAVSRCRSSAKNANRWVAPPLDADDVRRFRRRLDETGITPAVSHASYLINLASTNSSLRAQSMDALADELDRAHRLALLGVVLHPGTCTAGTEDEALSLIAQAIRAVFARQRRRPTMILLEHTAGQGRTVGYRFDHLSTIIERLDGSPRSACVSIPVTWSPRATTSSHPGGYQSTFREFDKLVGLARLKAFHGNDSKRPCGARVDRHEHIGQRLSGSRTLSSPDPRSTIRWTADSDRNRKIGARCREAGVIARIRSI